MGLLVRLAVGMARRLVEGMGIAEEMLLLFTVVEVVVVGNVVMVLSWVPGSILIALPATNAKRLLWSPVCVN